MAKAKKSSRKVAAVKKTTAKKRTAKLKPWFVYVRGSYLPSSWQGWLTYVPFVLLLLLPLKTIHNAWQDCQNGGTSAFCANDTDLVVLVRIIAAAAIYYTFVVCAMTILAKRKS